MIDLHAHTTISDGTLTPKELIHLAKETGLEAVAITDHDSIAGLAEAQEEADKLGITLVSGIEFSAKFGENRLIHILGLGIDIHNDGFDKIYSNYRKERSEKLATVFEKLQSMGVAIGIDDVQLFVSGGYMDRQAIAKCLVAQGYTSSVKESWIKYLDKIVYTEGELIQPEDAFKAIHAAGGKAFLAHYHLPIGLKGYSEEEVQLKLKELKDLGLDGLECYYPSFSQYDQLRCENYIKDFDFIKSGGTDFHGANRPHIKLGVGEGDFKVPDELLEKIVPKLEVLFSKF
ncbi:PHP domain-containing protein [Carboxylicivirga linearis]|uniref:PHP domain-containing protein n=1 Tax=Carboxylicivirga linearis TaxID=1628157 RepID=A0ABS5JWV4_9BACT|nr:PHP domain-containing protein [Carboxylicivirga linearis]MBS2099407.1 PHP domain-containing protein [Carboxylicivirga linearis]